VTVHLIRGGRTFAGAAACALVAGCQSQVSLQLATSGALDAAQATHVRLAISGVQLTDESGNVTTFDSADGGVKEMFDYDGGATLTLLSGAEVPSGRYVSVALSFNPVGAEVENEANQTRSIVVPTDPSPVDADFTLARKDGATIWMNLDLRLSLADQTTTTNNWRLVPRMAVVDLDRSASLTGTISAANRNSSACLQGRTEPDGAAVYAYPLPDLTPYDESPNASPHPTGTVLVSWNSDGTGSYAFTHLSPGSYTIALTCVASQDDPLSDQNLPFVAAASVALAEEEDATLDFE
jgi:hypothetical protein